MIIAERILSIRIGEAWHPLRVEVTAPQCEDNSWFSSFSIAWPEGRRMLKVGGADSLQALVCTLQLLGAELYASKAHKEGRLLASDGRQGFGVPVPSNFRPDLVGDDQLYV